MSVGTLIMHHTPLDAEVAIFVTFDFSQRHEVLSGGQTLIGSPTVRVLLNGATSTDLTVANVALDVTAKMVQFNLTDAGVASVGSLYVVSCKTTLSGGETLVETLDVYIDGIG